MIQSLQTDQDFTTDWSCTTAQPRIAALRHDGNIGCGATSHHGSNFVSARGPDYTAWSTVKAAAPISDEWFKIIGTGQHITYTNDLGKLN
jgi:hypothetical protein